MEASQDRCSLIRCRFLPQKRRRIKNFVLHCNRCTVVTGLFNLNFVHIWKEGTLGTKLISEKSYFCLNQLTFLFQTDLGEISHCPKWSGKKNKPLFNQIGLKTKMSN